jgi:hypothetical protein
MLTVVQVDAPGDKAMYIHRVNELPGNAQWRLFYDYTGRRKGRVFICAAGETMPTTTAVAKGASTKQRQNS